MRDYKVRIIQPVILEYRLPLYYGLHKKYGERLEIWASDRCGCDKGVPLTHMSYDYSHSIVQVGPFLWQKGLSLHSLGRGDVIVVCGDIHNLSVLWLACKARMRGIGVVWWSHHWSATSTFLKMIIRLLAARVLSDVFLCYTRTGIDFLKAHGLGAKPIFATGNTINHRPIDEAMGHWDGPALNKFQDDNNVEGKNIVLVCGVLREKMKLHMLIKALADQRLIDRNVIVAIIGDGNEREKSERLARELQVDGRIIWVGATRDQMKMAPWFLLAKVFVYPGAIGLGILHSLFYGLPVVVHGSKEHQMPEFEVMEDGKTGLLFEEDSIDDMVDKIIRLLDDPDGRSVMRQYSMQKVRSEYSIDNMVDNFSMAIECAHMAISDAIN